MSLKDYIERKSNKPNIVLSINDYAEMLRENLLSLKNKQDLYNILFDINDLSKSLNRISYPRTNELIFHVSMEEINKFKDEYSLFLDWCKKNKNENVKNIEMLITNLRSFQFMNEDVSLEDIEFIVEYKCRKARENIKKIIDFITEENQFQSEDVKINVISDREFYIESASFKFSVYFDKTIKFETKENNESIDFIRKQFLNFDDKFKMLYFLSNKKNRGYITENIRKMYLGKIYDAFHFEFFSEKKIPNENEDLWCMKIKNKYVIYECDSYKLIDDFCPIRSIELEEK